MKKIICILIIISALAGSFKAVYSQWTLQNTGISINLNRIQFVNSQTGWAGGYQAIPVQYTLIKSTNGGASWFNQTLNLPSGNRIISLFFLDANTGWICGADGFFKTTNGGDNYFTQTSPSIVTYDCYFVNALTGWAVGLTGSTGKVDKSTDGGNTWTTQTSNISQYEQLFSVHFEDLMTGWCAGYSTIIKTTNGGVNWTPQSHPACSNITCIYAVSSNNAWVSAEAGTVLSTTNGGTDWVLKYTGYSNQVNSVFFTNSMTGYAVTLPARILKTTNSGTNWYSQFSDTSLLKFNNVFFLSDDTGYVCGWQGKVYKTTNAGGPIGIKEINGIIPESYFLSQNYPNPFNPVTKIKFDIPKTCSVELIVYDMLGKQIEVLVNKNLSPGLYVADFDAGKLSGGVYFYRIIAGDSISTRKMLLIK